MSQQTPTGYVPIPSAMSAANVASRALVAAMTFQSPQDGMMTFCSEAGFQGLYVLSLNSGAVVDGTDVLSTTVGGASRWMKIQIGPVAAPVVPGGADTNVQFNDVGAFGGAAHLVYDKATGLSTIDTALRLGAGPYPPTEGQIRHTSGGGATGLNGGTEVYAYRLLGGFLAIGSKDGTSNRVDNTVICADAAGGIFHRLSGADKMTVEAAGVAFGAIAGSYGGGTQMVFIQSTALPPAGNPVGGGVVYVDAVLGLVFKGTAGTVTPIAPM